MEQAGARVVLVTTVLNEGTTIDALLASVAAQTRPPDEVRLVDGGSTDDTVARARAWAARGLPLTVDVRPGANISAGRNAAIAATRAPLVAVTDAGVRLAPDWLAHLTRPFADPGVDAVAGFFRAAPRTPFEYALGATTLPAERDVDPARFLPSSRSVAFRRAAWERVGGYPEWLDYCEDLVFDLALREAGCRFAFAPRALAYFRPRPTLCAFFRQYYLYARGDGKADLWRKRHAVRYATYLGLPLLAALVRRQPAAALPALLLAGAYLHRPYQRLWQLSAGQPAGMRLAALPWPPLIRLTGDVAKMLGYPAGVAWRLRQPRLKAVTAPVERGFGWGLGFAGTTSGEMSAQRP
ncbi:MAG TPA: glycosyltransferase [Chloroflexota bacterium]|jgi:glycosyltransferase involved in cell wall biosynthesis